MFQRYKKKEEKKKMNEIRYKKHKINQKHSKHSELEKYTMMLNNPLTRQIAYKKLINGTLLNDHIFHFSEILFTHLLEKSNKPLINVITELCKCSNFKAIERMATNYFLLFLEINENEMVEKIFKRFCYDEIVKQRLYEKEWLCFKKNNISFKFGEKIFLTKNCVINDGKGFY
ncbi:hypothetical protein DMUE_0155 [Dictyocoela muelleri]|nr:hypothetical protein DMUE_0155 [Dictyocoela muelleri]